MTILESVRAWLSGFPGLEGGRLHVDFLPEDAQTYSVDVIPSDGARKKYLDGSAMLDFLFVLSSRDFYGADTAQALDNYAFFESFTAWVASQNRARTLPVLGTGKTSRRVTVTNSAYLFAVDESGLGRYQIQCKLTYFQKGER